MSERFEKHTKKQTAYRIVLTIGYFLLCYFFLALIIFEVFFPIQAIKIFGFNFYTISYTGSMEPELKYNDLIIVRDYNFNKLKEGDIITFLAHDLEGEEIVITHKIKRVFIDERNGERYYQTQGVNSPYPDRKPVTIDGAEGTNRYIGKFAFKSSGIGSFLAYLKTPYGATVVSVNSILLFVIIHLLGSEKVQKKDVKSTKI